MGKYAVKETLNEATKSYIESRWNRGEITPATRSSFRETLRSLSSDLGGMTSVARITRADIEKWLGSMHGADATKRLRLSTVKGFFQWAMIEDKITRDPTLGIRGPKKTRTVPRGLSESQVDAVLNQARDARELLILTLMLEEGLRAGGVAGLNLRDIDFASGTLVATEKGGHSRRLPLTETTREAIDRYLEVRGQAAGPLLLSYARHEGITSKYVVRLVGDAFRRAGVDESGHVLRHMCAHNLIAAGASITEVRDVLGHASISTTQIYLPTSETPRLRILMNRGA